MRVSTSSIIKVPLGVQLNRMAFALCAVVFAWLIWHFRHDIGLKGWLMFGSFIFCSLLGLIYSCVRARWSRLVLVILDLLIPLLFWVCFFAPPPHWWQWLIQIPAFCIPFIIPALLAWTLFKHRRTDEYFTRKAT